MLLAGSSLLTLLDDIATLLDDISVMGKLAAKKTAGVLGDDLSLNAQQVSGVRANRELPVVWGVAKGSLINKVILVPLALVVDIGGYTMDFIRIKRGEGDMAACDSLENGVIMLYNKITSKVRSAHDILQ